MKSFLIVLSLLLSAYLSAQIAPIKFTQAIFENGMTYPQVIIDGKKNFEDSINSDILKRLEDVKANDFCIGQYGYVQKSHHLQIHVFCNCIDFEESENRYFLYNLETGRPVSYSDLIDPKQWEEAGKFIEEELLKYGEIKSLTISDVLKQHVREKNLDALHVIMTRDGIEVKPADESWGDKKLALNWAQLKPYLRYQFI